MLLRFGFLTLLIGHLFVVPLRAQSNACHSSVITKTDQPAAEDDSGFKEIVDVVEFHGDNPVSEAQQSKLTGQIQELSMSWTSRTSPATNDDWVQFAADAVREELLNTGYFKAIVNPKPFLIRANKFELHYAVRLYIESGPQYRLGNVQFESSDPDLHLNISPSLLRQQLELKEGDIFDVSKIRESLDRLYKLYQSKGYIDEVPTPETTISEKGSTIKLVMKIEEGKPYRIARIEVLGLSPQKVQDLQLPQSAGEIFNPRPWSQFFEDNLAQLRSADPDQIMQISRHASNSAVSLTLDFRACSQDSAVLALHSRDADLDSAIGGAPADEVRPLRTRIEAPPDTPKP